MTWKVNLLRLWNEKFIFNSDLFGELILNLNSPYQIWVWFVFVYPISLKPSFWICLCVFGIHKDNFEVGKTGIRYKY